MWGGSLAILSTIIGGGIVGLPFALYHTGIPVGILLNLVFAALTLYSCVLYIKAREFIGNVS
jgi:amino acid permease